MAIGRDVKRWADSRETSEEIAQGIFELSNNNKAKAQRIWQDPTDPQMAYVATRAFELSNEDLLYWGEEEISRP